MPPPGDGLLLLSQGGSPIRDLACVIDALPATVLTPAALVVGADARLDDPRLGSQAAAFVLVLPPTGNLSNMFYRVHRRRNDRFLTATMRLKALFPEIDFADFHFTGHMLATLADTCPERFTVVRRTLAAQWLERMQQILALLPVRGVLAAPPQPECLPLPTIPLPASIRCVDVLPGGDVSAALGGALADVLGQRV